MFEKRHFYLLLTGLLLSAALTPGTSSCTEAGEVSPIDDILVSVNDAPSPGADALAAANGGLAPVDNARAAEYDSLTPEDDIPTPVVTESKNIEYSNDDIYSDNGFYPSDGALLDPVQWYGHLTRKTQPVQEDFAYLYAQNPDIVGWLLADEYINYPVVQYDNDFYLHHDFDGKEDGNGTLFVNEYNLLLPRDWLIMIHGHHMRSGAMFGRLQAYEDASYLHQHPLLIFRTIYDEYDVYYTPVAGFNASMNEDDPTFFNVMEPWAFFEEETASFRQSKAEAETESEIKTEIEAEFETEFETEFEIDTYPADVAQPGQEYTDVITPFEAPSLTDQELAEVAEKIRSRKDAYLQSILNRSLWQSPADASPDDQYLMLVTCSYYQDNGRFMLLCRMLRDDETPETVRELYATS